MPDGAKRKRRNGDRGEARKRWYAAHRARRFARRFSC
jgi:hypothetical protein